MDRHEVTSFDVLLKIAAVRILAILVGVIDFACHQWLRVSRRFGGVATTDLCAQLAPPMSGLHCGLYAGYTDG